MTDRREMTDDQGMLFRAALAGNQASIWTALPGFITKFDASRMVCEVQPTIQMLITDPRGNKTWQSLPLLLDCPVLYPGGGGFTLTFPIQSGDECLVMFASRCIDSWWQSGGIQVQAQLRMHDLSDGFVLVGPRSQPHVIPGVNTSNVQLRANDGSSYIDIDPSGNITARANASIIAFANASINAQAGTDINAQAGGNIIATAAGTAHVTAPVILLTGNVTVQGNLNVSGNISGDGTLTAVSTIESTGGDITAGGVPYLEHVHQQNDSTQRTYPPGNAP